MNIFEQATKQRLRFQTTRGEISTEDLWSLPLVHQSGCALDDIAKGLNKQIKESVEESFVKPADTTNAKLALKFDIVKHIIAVRLEEADRAKQAAARKERKELLGALIAEQQVGELRAKGLEELQKMYNEL